MKKTCMVFMAMLLVAFFSTEARSASGDRNKQFIPSPVPVNIKPPSYDEYYLGVGLNQMDIKVGWEDDFFTAAVEDVGNLKYTATNLAIALVKSNKNSSTVEYDLLLGKLTATQDNDTFHSGAINKDVNLNADVDGYDVGLRIIKSKTLKRQMRGGSKFIDWNYAYSLHVAIFHTNGTFTARSTDGLDTNVYDETETGIFLRPLIALQPIIYLHNRVSLIPYVGVGTMLALSDSYWKVTEVKSNGVVPTNYNYDGEGIDLWYTGLGTRFGFDVGIVTNASKKHEITIGGAISKLVGNKDADFTEFHVMYTIPYAL